MRLNEAEKRFVKKNLRYASFETRLSTTEEAFEFLSETAVEWTLSILAIAGGCYYVSRFWKDTHYQYYRKVAVLEEKLSYFRLKLAAQNQQLSIDIKNKENNDVQ